MGLYSFGCCSGMSELLRCKICMCIYSNGSKRDGLLICFRSVILSIIPILPRHYTYSTAGMNMAISMTQRHCWRPVLYSYYTPEKSVNFYHTARCHVTADFNNNNLSVVFM
jgi:hypothetical protein